MPQTEVTEHESPQRRRRSLSAAWLLAGVALALAAVLGGCSDDSSSSSSAEPSRDATSSTVADDPASTDTTTEPHPAADATAEQGSGGSTPVSAVEADVIRRYLAFWEARHSANTGIPDPASPALVESATGEQLGVVTRETQRNLDQGLTFQERSGPAAIQRVRVVEVDGDRAQVQECVVDDELLVDRNTGAVVDDSIETHSVVGALERVGGEWRVSSVRLVQQWEGVAGCALAS
jgi:hypothetical protein